MTTSAPPDLLRPAAPAPTAKAAASKAQAAMLARQRRLRDLGQALLFSAPALAVFFAFTYWPFLRAIYLSLHVTNNAGQTSRFNGLAYYVRILGLDGRTAGLESIWTSFSFALMVVPAGIVLALALAMLATSKVRGISIFRTIFTSSIAISLASAGVIWALIYNPATGMTAWLVNWLGINSPTLLNDPRTSLPAVALMTVWSGLGFNFIITLAGAQSIPRDLYESAAIDGATRWQAFQRVTLPLLSPTLLFLMVVNTISSLQAFTQIHILIPNRQPNVFVYATFRSFWYDNRYGYASAMSIVLFVVLLVLTALQYAITNRKVHYQ